jgi:hypothetical protein
MPRATVTTETVKKDLNSVEGGWVELKQLSFDQMLERRDKALRMSLEQEASTNRGKRRNVVQKIDLESASQWSRQFEFANCIVDHNLENEKGEKLNFTNPMTLSILDPKVGAEIERYIEELNEEGDEESLEDFMKRQSSSSSDNGTTQNTTTDES